MAHCGVFAPSGGAVTPSDLDTTALGTITLGSLLIVNTDTGAIGTAPAGTSLRPAGVGVINGIDFRHVAVGAGVGVFRFQGLTVNDTVEFRGSAAVALVAGGDIRHLEVVRFALRLAEDRTLPAAERAEELRDESHWI